VIKRVDLVCPKIELPGPSFSIFFKFFNQIAAHFTLSDHLAHHGFSTVNLITRQQHHQQIAKVLLQNVKPPRRHQIILSIVHKSQSALYDELPPKRR
jgi:hypothetical protein